MKLINVFQPLKHLFRTRLPNHEIVFTALISISLLVALSLAVWFIGPHITWGDYIPLAQPDKRGYVILVLTLAWILKFLLVDLDAPNPFQYKDPHLQKKLLALQNHFNSAIQFLKKTSIQKQGKSTSLNELPWYLLIGPMNAGKTSLLAKSSVNFILHKPLPKDTEAMTSSETLDWWITREASLIDTPGKYISAVDICQDDTIKCRAYPLLWRFFLRLLRKRRGKQSLSGIVIALPLPDIIKHVDTRKYQAFLRDLFQRLYEAQKYFPYPIPCQLVITKCDLLPGFSEFFSELSEEEMTQAWGILLSDKKTEENVSERFDALIKKLNQQLLSRLHQERNPLTRPYIKDFPLQLERLKMATIDFVKRFYGTHLPLSLKSIHLTSALQLPPQEESTTIESNINTTQRALQLFKAPTPATRAYFIKQFLTHGLATLPVDSSPITTPPWIRRATYATSIFLIIITAILLGRDFEHGIKQAYLTQNTLTDYHLAAKQTHDSNVRLENVLILLNTLQPIKDNKIFKLDLTYLLTFYTHKSQEKTQRIYHEALLVILLPEIKNYLEDYLKLPVNKTAEHVYGVLKAYLMLGDKTHFNQNYVLSTMQDSLPKSFSMQEKEQFIAHLTMALNTTFQPTALDGDTISRTRKYLSSLPNLQLAYIILKNMGNNNIENEIKLGLTSQGSPIFTSRQMNQVPSMFTAEALTAILSEQLALAAQEASEGNWVVGMNNNKTALAASNLIDQLKTTYINNYVDVWESLLANIQLTTPSDLAQIDTMIVTLISDHSPLLQLLQTLHDQTYFEPITAVSPKLQSLGFLVEKTNTSTQLYEILSGLQTLHQYIQSVLTATDAKKAAFDLLTNRIKNINTPDALTQLIAIAEKSPDPIKSWLHQLANHTWRFVLIEAGSYIDTAWQNQVMHPYQTEIANRYPFSINPSQEVALPTFIHFFGNPGVVVNFYNQYLQTLVDTTKPIWHWKTIGTTKLPFSDETLGHIQQAIRIHHAFFPNGDNKLFVQFALQPYQVDKEIKKVKITINDKKIIDENGNPKNPHLVTWPGNSHGNTTSIQFSMANQANIGRHFPGEWGWFKLVHQSIESEISRQQVLLNISLNQYPVKYVLLTGQINPFLSLNLQDFHLPQQLTTV